MIISQFDTDPTLLALAHLHHHWHDAASRRGDRVLRPGQPGAGTEFITFHRSMVDQFFAWNNANGQPISTALLAAFTGVPFFLKTNGFGWNSAVGLPASFGFGNPTIAEAENRILNDKGSFASLDMYAQYIEVTIHNWIHGAIASWLNTDGDPGNNDPWIGSLHSPQSTYFYQIHGLIDLWARNFAPKSVVADAGDLRKAHFKEWKEFAKEHIKEGHKELVKDHIKEGVKEIIKDSFKEHMKEDIKEGHKEFKEKDKDMVENPDFRDDPRILERDNLIRDLTDRISKIEARANKGKAFIKRAERPDVGKPKGPKGG